MSWSDWHIHHWSLGDIGQVHPSENIGCQSKGLYSTSANQTMNWRFNTTATGLSNKWLLWERNRWPGRQFSPKSTWVFPEAMVYSALLFHNRIALVTVTKEEAVVVAKATPRGVNAYLQHLSSSLPVGGRLAYFVHQIWLLITSNSWILQTILQDTS